MFLPGRFNAAFRSAPAHNGRIGSKPTFKYFIPANNLLSLRVQKFFNAPYKVTLQFMFIFKMFIPDSALAFLAKHPSVFGALISTDMNVFSREQFADFT